MAQLVGNVTKRQLQSAVSGRTYQIPLTYRNATLADVPALLPLIRTAYRSNSTKGWTTEAHLVADQRISSDSLESKITCPDGTVLIAEDESGSQVGCCEVQLQKDGVTAYFGLFAVDPERQAAGLGGRLLARAEQYAQETWGAKRMEMWVIWLRDELIAWYKRKGYRETDSTSPFPYNELVDGPALRNDLYFKILEKTFDICVSN